MMGWGVAGGVGVMRVSVSVVVEVWVGGIWVVRGHLDYAAGSL